MALFKHLFVLILLFLQTALSVDWLKKSKEELIKLRGAFDNQKADILFLVDSSGSLDYQDFQKEKKFVDNLLNAISVSYEATRVEVIPFQTRAYRFIKFISEPAKGNNKCYFKENFNKLNHEWGATNMRQAFQIAFDICLGKWQGNKRQPMSRFKTVVIVLTDGDWNWPYEGVFDPSPLAKKLIDNDAEVFAIGVGNLNFQNLQKLVAGQDPNRAYAFHLKDFNEFNELATYIRGDPYQKVWETTKVTNDKCNNKCHTRAVCACGLVYGDYKCSCPTGMYGAGGSGDCTYCEKGRYKDFEGFAAECDKCPDFATTDQTGSVTVHSCKCLDGYFGQPHLLQPCQAMSCSRRAVPLNGYIVGGSCKNVYGSECAFACNEGYKRNGQAKHTCNKLSGSGDDKKVEWDTDPITCTEITCSSLGVSYSQRKCVNQNGTDAQSMSYRVKCTFTCDRGYRPKGDSERTCSVTGQWSGTPLTCNEVRCDKLSKPSIGSYEPAAKKCDEQSQKFDTSCEHRCPTGYHMHPGPMSDKSNTMVCNAENGTWTGSKRVCKDHDAPVLTCPKNQILDNDVGKSTATVNWKFSFDDNSLHSGAPGITNESFTIAITINGVKRSEPKELEIGTHTVIYNVTDADGNYDKCSFVVEVRDVEPPTCEFCPPSKEIQVDPSKENRLNWDSPTCSDNSGIPPRIEPNKRKGLLVSEVPALVTIEYRVTDQSNNEYLNCSFTIKLTVPECKEFKPPKNGASTCNVWQETLFCSVQCKSSHDFVFKPPTTYMCQAAAWSSYPVQKPLKLPWPDCSKRENPSQVSIMANPSFYFDGDCNNPNVVDQLKDKFIGFMKSPMNGIPPFFCAFNQNCNKGNLRVFCGETDASVKRKRRSSTKQVYFKVKYVEDATNVQAGSDDAINQKNFDLSKSDAEKKRQQVYDGLKAADWNAFKVSSGLDGSADRFSLKHADGFCSQDGAVVKKCWSSQFDPTSWDPNQHQCNADNGDVTKCIRCPVGTYYDSDDEKCNICPEGQYVNQEGALKCNNCPPGTWTFGDKKENFTSCQAECGPGYFSNTGIAPCFQCPAGTYSSEKRNKNCTQCPSGTTSVSAASQRLEDCGMVCAAGTYSHNGVEPCNPCPLGTFQNATGKPFCLPCPGRLSTYGTGADSVSSCIEVNDCASSPCNNNGQCIDTKESYRCECPEGYRGKNCDEEVDDCADNPCFGEATCVDKVSGFLCLCPDGYQGPLCDQTIETCTSQNPCVRGVCKENGAGSQCLCPVGFEGQFCELNTDECASSPCQNNAVCIGGIDTFRCICQPGYSGKLCQINNDDCVTDPCKNNGKCIDGDQYYTCQCPAGYTGKNCEYEIDECQPDPCQNGGKCNDLFNDFKCDCKLSYTGKRCEKQLSSDFDLAFQDRVSDTYAKINKVIPDITQFTVAMWIRTTDTNPGVPLSYACSDGGKIQDNALVIQDCSGANLFINNITVFLGVDINDGYWHHFAVTWQSSTGIWAAFVDGTRFKTATSPFQQGHVIRGGGVMIAGQEQDKIGGGFNAEESFMGDMSQLNVWSRVLTDNEIYNLAETCDHAKGDIASWADFREDLAGFYTITSKSYACEFHNSLRYATVTYNASIPSNDNKVISSSTPEACLASCTNEQSFLCRSFDYNKKTKTCYLSTKHSPDNLLKEDFTNTYDYYQLNCDRSLGISSKTLVPDSHISASSILSQTAAAFKGRLYTAAENDMNGATISLGGWCASAANTNQWLQVRFNNPMMISAAITQGRQDADEWVTSYKIQYSTDGTTWSYYPHTIQGNSDRNTPVRRELRVFTARYVRFRPQAWKSRICMRVELSGCPTRKVKLADSVNECATNPCLNGGVCANRYGGYMCLCGYGFTGTRCETAIPCSDPGTPIYGSKSSTNYNHGSTITFTCRTGYRLSGASSRTCTGGQWTGTQPTCNDINECTSNHGCGQHCRNTHGSYLCACSFGYQLSGKSCVDINECTMDNGGCSHSCHNTAGGVACTCPRGMIFTPGKRTCEDVDECASNNGGCQHNCENTLGSFKCSCNKGYALNSNKINCDGLSCPSLSPISYGTIQAPSNVFGRKATYTCNAGYKVIGPAVRECLADRTWSGVQPHCQRVYCREVGTVKYASRSLTGYLNNRPVVGSIARFTCDAHHTMQGNRDHVCQNDGSWSGELPRCIPSFCPKLATPLYGTIQGYRFELGATLRITCATGYELNPKASSFRTCTKISSGAGTWSGLDPKCQLIDCGDPGNPYNGYRHIPGGTKYQATVTYTCQPQNHLQGKKSRVCQADGTWSDEKPVCLERSCGYLDEPANGKKLSSDHQYGQSVTFECNTGYTLVGSPTLTCQSNGLWTADEPTCQIVDCKDPGTPANGRRFADKFVYQSVIYFECNPRYKLVGSTKRLCQADGTWTDSQPTCIATNCGAPLVGPNGVITSPNYPSNYGNNQYCTWEVTVPVDKKVRLDFKNFKTETGKDYLMVYDTNSPFPTIYFDGTTYLPGSFTSSGNSLRLRFMSDGQNTLAGFKVEYKQIDPSCGGTLTDSTGYIESPKFPNQYDHNLDCVWLISRPGIEIEFALLEFDTESTYDYLAFTLGREQSQSYQWSGLGTPIKHFTSESYMWLHFKTNYINSDMKSHKGFRGKYYKHNPYANKKKRK